jgi:hypothetical protein
MEDNQEMIWDNPLRYALAIVMGAFDHAIGKTYTASEQVKVAKDVLFRSSSPNGLFPGQINATSKEAELFEDEAYRDFHFHVTFEIPYILLWEIEQQERDRQKSDRQDERDQYRGKSREEASAISNSQESPPNADKDKLRSTLVVSKSTTKDRDLFRNVFHYDSQPFRLVDQSLGRDAPGKCSANAKSQCRNEANSTYQRDNVSSA